jgi:hypothetical protein
MTHAEIKDIEILFPEVTDADVLRALSIYEEVSGV